LNVLDRKM